MDEQSIFLTALDKKNDHEQAKWLDEACGPNSQMRQRIEALLDRHQEDNSLLEKPALAGLDATFAPLQNGNGAGAGNQSVLKSLGQTVDSATRVVLREPLEVSEDWIVMSTSPEIPVNDPGSRYQLQGELARGGMGAIIKGRDTDLGRDLAIKVLLDEHKHKPEVVQRFIEEAQIGGQLQHPGIAPLYELGQFSDQRPFFSMKLIKGETLSALLGKRKNLMDDRAKLIGMFEQICQTMAYAHSRGVIHRDLKPSNIMVGAFGEVQVMDWGLAKVLSAGGVADEKKAHTRHKDVSVIQTRRSTGSDTPGSFGSQTEMGSVMGTPAYMPPEQALGEIDQLDQRTDVFGLGAILCEILTGKPPYVSDDPIQLFRLASRGKLDECIERLDACGADPQLIEITKQCLSAEPDNRPQNGGDLSELVTGYLESVETKLRTTELQRAKEAVRAESESARAELEVKRRRTTLALAAAVLIMVLMGGSWSVNQIYVKAQSRIESQSKVSELLADAQRNLIGYDQNLELADQKKNLQDVREIIESAKIQADSLEEGDNLRSQVGAQLEEVEKRFQKLAELEKNEKAQRVIEEVLAKIDMDPVSFMGKPEFYKGIGTDLIAQELEAVFAGLGIRLTGPVDVAANQIRNSPIQEDLIGALVNLVQHDQVDAKATANAKANLLSIFSALDPGDWHNELVNALANDDIEAVMKKIMDQEGQLKPEVQQQSATLIVWLSRALVKAEKFETSVDVLIAAHQCQPDDYLLNSELSMAHWRQKSTGSAIGYARAALAIRPTSIDAHTRLVLILSDIGRIDDKNEAVIWAKRAVTLDVNNSESHRYLGMALREAGELDAALIEYEKAIQLNDKSVHAYLSKCNCLYQMGKVAESIRVTKQALKLDPNSLHAAFKLAIDLRQQGNLKEALAELVKVNFELDKSPEAVQFRMLVKFCRIHVLAMQGQRAEARKVAESFGMNTAEYHFNMAMILILLPSEFRETLDSVNALDHAQKGQNLLSDHGQKGDKYHNLVLGVAQYGNQEWDKSSKTLNASLKSLSEEFPLEVNEGTYPCHYLRLAMCYHQLDQPDQAKLWHRKALDWRSKFPENKEPSLMRCFDEAEALLKSDSEDKTDPPNDPVSTSDAD